MGKTIKVPSKTDTTNERPMLTPESWETRMVAKAMKLAEKQLDEGTASSQVITTLIKLGTMERKLELKKLEHEIKLTEAKTKQIEAIERHDQMFKEAIEMFGIYSGQTPKDDDDDDDDGGDYYDDDIF